MKKRDVELLIYKTYFVLKINKLSLIEPMQGVMNKLKTYSFVYNKMIRRMVRKEDKSYFAYNPKEHTYRFTIGILKDVLITLGRFGVTKDDVMLIHKVNRNVRELNLKFNDDKFTLRDYQQTYSDILFGRRKEKPIMLVDLQTGMGKMQDLNTKIRIPNGWKRMGDIQVGDLVMTKDGSYTKVTGVFPHGKKEMYKLTFYDGRTARCGAEHLWSIIHSDDPENSFVVDTKFLYDKLGNLDYTQKNIGNKLRYYVPLVEAERNKDKDFFIHPYILGCLIGDGGISTGCVKLHIHDQQVIDKVKSLLHPEYDLREYKVRDKTGKLKMQQAIVMKDKSVTISNKYRDELSRLGLLYETALTKFIPEEYLNGSADQRWELLRGLMDTDGYVGKPVIGRTGKMAKCGTISYATSSIKLKETFQTLVRSLGGIVSYHIKHPTYTYKGEKRKGHDSYVMTLRLKYPKMCVTRTNKRAERLTELNQYSKYFKLRINKIEKIGEMEAQCISVKNPSGLYVCDDYVVTHNTTLSSHALTRINEVTMILVLPKYIEKWTDDMYKYTNIDEDDICIIQGSKGIVNLMLKPRDQLDYKVYIASITTMNYMISAYESLDKEYEYPMAPDDFMEHLGVGVILNDETHQHFHALLKVSLYMNVNQIIGLSATLDSNRPEMKKLYNYMFPTDNRISNIAKVEKYTYVKAIEYRLTTLRRIKYLTNQGYSHIAYEQSILKNKRFLDDYFDMIDYYVQREYINRKQDGEKLLIFMSTVVMCTLFSNYLKEKYSSLDVRRYVEDDPYENVINAEICVSTVISASTAVDIPKLITVINTISMASLQANIQTMGRLRKIEGREVWYVYLYTPQIPNQKNMHKIRRDTIKDRAKLIVYDEYPVCLRSH